MPQRLENIHAAKCEQCGEWFYYKRTTAKFCSDACRKSNQRDIAPTDKYKNGLYKRDERLAAIIAENNPRAFRKLQQIKDSYGGRALTLSLDLLELMSIVRDS